VSRHSRAPPRVCAIRTEPFGGQSDGSIAPISFTIEAHMHGFQIDRETAAY
jgi:hypothetical protein